MALFIALLALGQCLPSLGRAFVFQHAEFWIYPAQTILCGTLLIWFRDCYEFARPKHIAFTLLVAVAVFLIWIAPQQFLRFGPRPTGFDPNILGHTSTYWIAVSLRFLRLVIVVPLLEEIFWRAFLLRFVIDEKFERVPFGQFSWSSFAVVTLAFAFSHSRPDWPAALCTGALYNCIAYRARSLASCVLAHAITNCLLGLWIMQTRQWGFW
jgi:uncharacterized protein